MRKTDEGVAVEGGGALSAAASGPVSIALHHPAFPIDGALLTAASGAVSRAHSITATVHAGPTPLPGRFFHIYLYV